MRFGSSSNKLIMLHGWGGNTNSFFHLASSIREKFPELEILVLDYPGFGLSDFPPEGGFDTKQYAAWLYDFMTLLSIPKAHFYGHSRGGSILVRLLQQQPQAVKKAIFSCAAGIKPPKSGKQKIAEKLKNIGKILPKKLRKFLLVRVLDARDWGEVKPGNKATLEKILAEPDLREELKKIDHPSLVMWGAKDSMTPYHPCGELYIRNLGNSESKVFATGRHGIHHTHQTEIAELVSNFLKS